jgi:preprotein translocase subunit SecG
MYILVSVLILIACVLLILVVLVQNSKGGGLASNFAGSNQFMGVRKTADFLEKATWTLAIVLLVLSLVSVFVIPPASTRVSTNDTELREKIDGSKAAAPVKDFQEAPGKAAPAQGTPAPAQGTPAPAKSTPAPAPAPAQKK